MITFTCKKDESIVIGSDIVVTVVEVRGDKVRLGIENQGDGAVRETDLLDAFCQGVAESVP